MIFFGSAAFVQAPFTEDLDVARELLVRYGGVRGLLTSDRARVCRHHGFGPAKFAQLQAALELGRRFLAERMQHVDALTSPPAAKNPGEPPTPCAPPVTR